MKMHPLLKLVLELGPLAVFFLANSARGIYVGTGAFMAATVVALAVSYVITRTLPLMPLVTAVFVLVFGGLTLYLANDLFIKLKPTIVNLTFATILTVGLFTNRLFIKLILESAMPLTERGYVLLTRAWIGFFVVMAGLNELVWRSFDTDMWVKFKVFGIMPLTLVFSAATVPIMLKHAVQQNETAGDSDDAPVDRP